MIMMITVMMMVMNDAVWQDMMSNDECDAYLVEIHRWYSGILF